MQRLRIGIMGAGRIANFVYLPVLLELPTIKVVAVADARKKEAEFLADRFGGAVSCTDPEELLRHDLDAVFVLTARRLHLPTALPFLEASLPVYIEKPLAYSMQEANSLVAAARRGGAVNRVAYMKTMDPAVRRLKAMIRDETFGRPSYAALHAFGGNWSVGATIAGEQPIFASTEYGIDDPLQEWLEMWIHEVNLARALFGDPTEVLWASNNRPRLAIVRYGEMTVKFEVGLKIKRDLPWDEHLSVYSKDGCAHLAFQPLLQFRAPSRLQVQTRTGLEVPSLAFVNTYAAEVQEFLNDVRTGVCTGPTFEDGLRDVELCARIVEAAT